MSDNAIIVDLKQTIYGIIFTTDKPTSLHWKTKKIMPHVETSYIQKVWRYGTLSYYVSTLRGWVQFGSLSVGDILCPPEHLYNNDFEEDFE